MVTMTCSFSSGRTLGAPVAKKSVDRSPLYPSPRRVTGDGSTDILVTRSAECLHVGQGELKARLDFSDFEGELKIGVTGQTEDKQQGNPRATR
jgi:hypothetical protein